MAFFATVSDSLKVWEFSGNEIAQKSFYGHSSDYSSIYSALAWNHTNQVVAVATNRRIEHVHASSGQFISSLPYSDADYIEEDINALSFSGNSRYVACASGHHVLLWDLKKKSFKSMLDGHRSTVSDLAFFLDGDIVSGDLRGFLRVWDLKSNSSSEMRDGAVDSTSSSICCLKVCPQGPPKVSAGYSDGSIGVWDPVTQRLLRRQAVCTRSVAALCYSPKNVRLVAIAGADGRMALVDTGSKSSSEPSASLDVGAPLTSIGFHENAIHCAVGTADGEIFMYDWRNIRRPVCKIVAYDNLPVRALHFQVFMYAYSYYIFEFTSRQSFLRVRRIQ